MIFSEEDRGRVAVLELVELLELMDPLERRGPWAMSVGVLDRSRGIDAPNDLASASIAPLACCLRCIGGEDETVRQRKCVFVCV